MENNFCTFSPFGLLKLSWRATTLKQPPFNNRLILLKFKIKILIETNSNSNKKKVKDIKSPHQLENMSLQFSEKIYQNSSSKTSGKSLNSLDIEILDIAESGERNYVNDLFIAPLQIRNGENQGFPCDYDDHRLCNQQVEELRQALEEAQLRNENLEKKVEELSDSLQAEKNWNSQYFATLDSLEKENEKLLKLNMELNRDNEELSKKLDLANRQIEMAKRESATERPRRIERGDFLKEKEKAKQAVGKIEKDEAVSMLQKNMNGELSEDNQLENDFNEIEYSIEDEQSHYDDVWIGKLRFLREKLANGQRRCKNLEFLLETQKNYLDAANQTISKLKEENQILESKHEKLKTEVFLLDEKRLKEKSKIDNVITFCELVNNCTFSKEELVDKLSKFPLVISSFLKGSSDTLSLRTKDLPLTNLLNSAKQHKELLKQIQNKTVQIQAKSLEDMTHELEDIKQTLHNVVHLLSNIFPTDDHSVLSNLENISQFQLTSKGELTNDNQAILNPHIVQTNTISSKNDKTITDREHIFIKAIQNSSSLIWNLRKHRHNSRSSISTSASTMTEIHEMIDQA